MHAEKTLVPSNEIMKKISSLSPNVKPEDVIQGLEIEKIIYDNSKNSDGVNLYYYSLNRITTDDENDLDKVISRMHLLEKFIRENTLAFWWFIEESKLIYALYTKNPADTIGMQKEIDKLAIAADIERIIIIPIREYVSSDDTLEERNSVRAQTAATYALFKNKSQIYTNLDELKNVEVSTSDIEGYEKASNKLLTIEELGSDNEIDKENISSIIDLEKKLIKSGEYTLLTTSIKHSEIDSDEKEHIKNYLPTIAHQFPDILLAILSYNKENIVFTIISKSFTTKAVSNAKQIINDTGFITITETKFEPTQIRIGEPEYRNMAIKKLSRAICQDRCILIYKRISDNTSILEAEFKNIDVVTDKGVKNKICNYDDGLIDQNKSSKPFKEGAAND